MKSAENLLIRPVEPGDLEVLARLAEEFEQYLNSLRPGRNRHTPMTAELFRQEIFGDDPTFLGLVAELDRRIVGYLFYYRGYLTEEGCRTIEVMDLYVAEGFRGAGIGQKLMKTMPEIAAKEGAKVIRTSVWRKNPRAISFYKALGASLAEDEIPVWWARDKWK
jgi:GNAT superfamily N-acetyltransferase